MLPIPMRCNIKPVLRTEAHSIAVWNSEPESLISQECPSIKPLDRNSNSASFSIGQTVASGFFVDLFIFYSGKKLIYNSGWITSRLSQQPIILFPLQPLYLLRKQCLVSMATLKIKYPMLSTKSARFDMAPWYPVPECQQQSMVTSLLTGMCFLCCSLPTTNSLFLEEETKSNWSSLFLRMSQAQRQ